MSENPWDRLSGASAAAADRGDMVRARELGGAARDAWLRHCEAVEAQIQGAQQDARAQRVDTRLGAGTVMIEAENPWDVLEGMAKKAAARGDMVQARELVGAAVEAWGKSLRSR